MMVLSLVVTIILLAAVIIISVNVLFFFLPAVQGAPFVPIQSKKIATVVSLAGARPGQQIAELGSGDGRLVIALAKAGVKVCGYEINPFLAWFSRWQIKRQGLTANAVILRKNFWPADLSSFDVVVIYGIDYVMARLVKKLAAELRPGAKIVSVGFSLPDRPPVKKENGVFLYFI